MFRTAALLVPVLFPVLLAGCADDRTAPSEVAPPRTGSSVGDAGTSDRTIASSEARTDASSERPRGVLLLVCDTLRADVLDPYGGETGTPAFSRVARDGTVWLENYAQGSWTLPSMASLMTGQWVTDELEALPAAAPSLAPLLAEQGLATAAFVANPVCGSKRGFARGFDHFIEFDERARAREVTAGFRAWLRALTTDDDADDEDWFAWVHLMDNHGPYRPARAHRRGSTSPGPTAADRTAWREAATEYGGETPQSQLEWVVEGSREVLSTRERYRGTVRQVDAALEGVLAELEDLGLLDTTLVVIASDHGELLFEHHEYRETLRRRLRATEGSIQLERAFGRGHDLYYRDETWRTPLLMMGPGVGRGTKVEHGSANVDVLPTILAALGLDAPDAAVGANLLEPTNEGRDLVFASGVIERTYGFYDTRAVLDLATDEVWLEAPRALISDADGDFTVDATSYTIDARTPLLIDADDRASRIDLRDALEAWKRGPRLATDDRAAPGAQADLIRLGYVDPTESGDPR